MNEWTGRMDVDAGLRERELATRLEHAATTEAHLRVALASAGIGTWEWDVARQSARLDEVSARILGEPAAAPDLFARVVAQILAADAVAGPRRTAATVEQRHDGPDRTPRWLELTGELQRDPAGAPARVVGTLVDVTVRRRAERRRAVENAVSAILADSDSLREAGPRLLGEVAGAEGARFGAIWLVDEPDQVLRPAEVWSGFECADALAAATRALTLAEGAGLPGLVWQNRAPRLAPAGLPGDDPRGALAHGCGETCALAFPIAHRGAVLGVVELHGAPLAIGLEPDLAGTMRTIGDQLGQFVARRAAEETVRRVLSASPSALYALRLRPSPRASWISDAIVRICGYDRDEALQADWWDAHIHPEDRPRIHLDTWTDGSARRTVEYRFRHRDGRYRWLRDEQQLILDEQGVPVEVIGSWTDVSDRVHLEEALRRAQKMEAIGVLAGGVAHDFNNLLSVIGCATELLRAMVPPDDAFAELVADVEHASERGAALTRQLLTFSRAQVIAARDLDPDLVLRGVEKMLRRLIGEDVALVTELGAGGAVHIDPGQLEQIVLNLAVNARDAMPRGGRLLIRTSPSVRDGRRYVRLEVIDTGVGMTDEVRARMFEPFFTTKGVGKGTGLGLATVLGIVHDAGGLIDVTSAPGEGTAFEILLPHVEAVVVAGVAPSHAVPHGHEVVLLVEDDPQVRGAARAALARGGYQVVEARDAAHARMLLASRGDVDLLLTDIVMPGGSGHELGTEVVAAHPGLRVLYMSGYVEDALERLGVVANHAFLHKPFTVPGLLRKVREALDARVSSAPR